MTSKNSPEKDVRIKDCRFYREEDEVRIDLTLENRSDRPLFTIPRIRCIQLDPSSGKLDLWLCDRGGSSIEAERKKGMHREFSAPTTTSVEAQSKKSVSVKLPVDMTRLVVHDDGTFSLERLDLTQAQEVRLHFAVDDKPFYYRPTKKGLVGESRAWGHDFDTSVKLERPAGM
jgi:hypothetical protein